VRYNDELLIDGAALVTPPRQNLFEQRDKVTVSSSSSESTPSRKKGNSSRLSLDMYKAGKPIADIAAERKLAHGTIVMHLIEHIEDGEISVYDLVPVNKVSAITTLLATDGDASLTSIKNKLGNDYSYEDIRAVIMHRKWQDKEKA
jgi:uncharacterized protein YpbB